MTRMNRLRRGAARGFTLIELMITVAVVAIITAIAYPAYTEQVARSHRAEARSAMMEATQWMERFYSENFRYDQNTAAVAVATPFAAAFPQVPASGTSSYTLSLENLAAGTYRMKATRTGPMTGDKCGNFLITHTGAKGLADFDEGRFEDEAAAVAACWR